MQKLSETQMCTRAECIEKLTQAAPYIRKEFGVESMRLFGSMARGDNRPDSDVDVFVEMPPKLFLLCELKEYLETLLKTSVDLIRRHSNMSPRFLNQVAKYGITIF